MEQDDSSAEKQSKVCKIRDETGMMNFGEKLAFKAVNIAMI